ncbi:flagellar assembly peptidoglycan hydrolase FlgJ [Saccharobesus litoralis]|uniref:Peptidoglycan hydrolase FlgJ n=2 Tax=Saccharobesus litoralis TaxID=2172099 RepID=A0A2S0VUR2_9ALTE|nr:flagellar assembly peptidoglycan hydrolase FlgJ [Saccharobesus litoralis]
MDKLEQTQMLYHDPAGLDQLRQAGQNNDKEALRKAAQHFESIFMNMLLKSMRKANEALEDKDSPFNSHSAKFYQGMADDQLATELSSTGALGLADIIVQQLSPEKDNYMPGSVVRSDGLLPDGGWQQKSVNPLALATEQADDEKNQDPLAVLRIHSEQLQNSVLKVAEEKSKQLSQFQQPIEQDEQFKDKQDFVSKLLPIAEKVASSIGLPPIAMVAQAALETGWGQKMIKTVSGDNAFNFFGIKADSRWQGDSAVRNTMEFKHGQMVTEKAKFRAYDSIEQGLSDYVSFIKDQPRYQGALKSTNDPQQYFTELQKAGYATDPNYAKKILSVLQDKVFNSAKAEKPNLY